MKKLVFAAVAAIALMASVSFVSCDKKAAPATDSVAVDSVVAGSVFPSWIQGKFYGRDSGH